jgi:chemotaxis protein MotB
LDEAPAFGRRVWLITFTDLVSLMLAFFVMLFAMSGVNVESWNVTSQSFTRTLNPSHPPPPPPPVAARNVPMVARAPALDLDYLAALFRRIRQGSPELVETRLTRLPDGLILALRPMDVFEGEGVTLSPAAAKTISAVGGILGNFSNRISVRLRADPALMLEAGHPSAWERALVRAAAVANALRAAGYDREIAAFGLTDGGLPAGQGSPIEDERIEIVILAELIHES